MKYAGETSLFEARFAEQPSPGRYEVQIVAADAANVNFGMATRELIVPHAK